MAEFRYAIRVCRLCGHGFVRHGYGDGHIRALYDRPQTAEFWSWQDHDPLDPYRDMVRYCGDALAAAPRIVDFGCGLGEVLGILRSEHGIPADRLLGVDFARPPGFGEFPFRSLDLNLAEAESFPGFDFALCAHVLEHVPEPRRLLTCLALAAEEGAHLYLETPDHGRLDRATWLSSNLYNAQHIQYFHRGSLTLLAESCGWEVERSESAQFGFVPRARLVAHRRASGDVAGNTRVYLDAADAARDGLAKAILTTLGRVGVLSVWGTGGDLRFAAADNQDLHAALRQSSVRLCDAALAGQTVFGRIVEPVEALKADDAPIVLTPRSARTRNRIREAIADLGIDLARIIDPYPRD